jgi:hypothetical protein
MPAGVVDARLPPESDPRIVVVHMLPGRLGTSVTPRPGVLKSVGINPVATETLSQNINSGKSSGAPPPDGSLTSKLPT